MPRRPRLSPWAEAPAPMCPPARTRHAARMITFDGVARVRGSRPILHDVTFAAAPGRITGFVGPNGAGKTTTLRILLGLERPDGGTALVGGSRYTDLARPLTSIGASLGGAGAHPARRAADHLAWVAASNGIPRRRVAEVLEEVGLAAHARRAVRTFSLGMAQRLGIATALLGEPPLLVLDEPINGLDPEGIRWVRGLVRRRADAGGTVLLSSHVMSELAEVVDDVVVIAGGTVRAVGTLGDVAGGYSSLEEAFFTLTAGGER